MSTKKVNGYCVDSRFFVGGYEIAVDKALLRPSSLCYLCTFLACFVMVGFRPRSVVCSPKDVALLAWWREKAETTHQLI